MTVSQSDEYTGIRPSDTKVAVIGLGLFGLVCLKRLLEQGFDVVGLEREAKIGGLWRYTSDTTKTSVLKTTQANASKQIGCYQDFPFPDDVPDFPSGAETLDYLESYANHFNLLPHCRFRTGVRRIDRSPDDDGWALEIDSLGLNDGQVEGSRVQRFDKVIFATGAFAKAFVPRFEGIEGFKGQVIHAQEYKTSKGLEGKRVAVVGLSNTGCDIAVDASEVADATVMIHRSGGRIIQRAPGGVPLDHGFTRRTVNVLRLLPSSVQAKLEEGILEKTMRQAFSPLEPRWGLLPAKHSKNSTPIANEYFIPMLHEHKLDCIKASIERFTPTGLDLKVAPIPGDDRPSTTHIEVDVVILATGYRFDYSPLCAEADPTQARETPEWDASPHSNGLPFPYLYQTIFSVAHPYSLAFLGPFAGYTVIAYKAAELAAQAITRVWLGHHPLPDRPTREKWCDAAYRSALLSIKDHNVPQIGPTYPLEMERWLNVAAGNGIEENLGWGWKAWVFWWNEGGFWKLVMGGVDTPFLGALFEGEIGSRKPWPGAKAAIEQVDRNEKKAEKAE